MGEFEYGVIVTLAAVGAVDYVLGPVDLFLVLATMLVVYGVKSLV